MEASSDFCLPVACCFCVGKFRVLDITITNGLPFLRKSEGMV
jgi:hypothetical protein